MSRDRMAVRASATAVGIMGLAVIVSWLFDISLPSELVPGTTTMKFNTAVCLAALASCLLVDRPRVTVTVCGLVCLLAGVTLLEYAVGDLGIDQLVVADNRNEEGPPGRMSGVAALCLIVLALAHMANTAGRRRIAQSLAASTVFVSAVAILGYVYGVDSLYSVGPYSTMALHTAVALVLLSIATLAAVPDGVVPWVLTGTDAGAILQRRLYPVALLVLPSLGLIRLVAHRREIYETGFAIALNITIASAILTGVTIRAAIVVRRLDDERFAAADALRTLNENLEGMVRERSDALEHERTVVAVLQDRTRIARDLHDRVIQRIFAVGMRLAGIPASTVAPDVHTRLNEAVDELDASIRELRQTIFELGRGTDVDPAQEIAATATRLEASLGFAPSLTISGDLDRIGDQVASHLVVVLREALSNVARHARATAVDLSLAVAGDEAVLVVADNGIGFPPDLTRRSGVANIRSRAAQLGGSAEWAQRAPAGTVLTFRAPVTTADDSPRQPG